MGFSQGKADDEYWRGHPSADIYKKNLLIACIQTATLIYSLFFYPLIGFKNKKARAGYLARALTGVLEQDYLK
jgi:hypothetical protein